MHFLIYILVFFLGTLINNIIGYLIGFRAGALLLYIIDYFIARKLCQKYDERQTEKNISNKTEINGGFDNDTVKAITLKYNATVYNNNLKSDFIDELLKPKGFCSLAQSYCEANYSGIPNDELFLKCSETSFYGSICATMMYYEDKELFINSIWSTLENNIDLKFIKDNALRTLNTIDGEEKSERIHKIFSEYINSVNPILQKENYNNNVCLHALINAYKLGMLVAIKETDSIKNDEIIDDKDIELNEDKQKTDFITVSEIKDCEICFCRKCGAKLLDEAVFCNKCGTKIVTM